MCVCARVLLNLHVLVAQYVADEIDDNGKEYNVYSVEASHFELQFTDSDDEVHTRALENGRVEVWR